MASRTFRLRSSSRILILTATSVSADSSLSLVSWADTRHCRSERLPGARYTSTRSIPLSLSSNLPDLVRMCHPPRFQDVEAAVALTVDLDVPRRSRCLSGKISPRSCAPGSRRNGARSVEGLVILICFKKSKRRVSIDLTSIELPTAVRLLIGSIMTTCGLNSLIMLWKVTRCVSSPCREGLLAWNFRSPLFAGVPKSIPIEDIFRTICSGDSSNAKYSSALPAPTGGFSEFRGKAYLPVPAYRK